MDSYESPSYTGESQNGMFISIYIRVLEKKVMHRTMLCTYVGDIQNHVSLCEALMLDTRVKVRPGGHGLRNFMS